MRRIGILGGAFDPIHIGHIQLAKEALCTGMVDQILFVPSGRPPHKSNGTITPSIKRYCMTALAIRDLDNCSLSEVEAFSGDVSYTVTTLKKLRAINHADRFTLILGSDALGRLLDWHQADQLSALCDGLITFRRVGAQPDLESTASAIRTKLGLQVSIVDRDIFDVSSTQLRDTLESEKAVSSTAAPLLPNSVALYIRQHALYHVAPHWVTEQLKSTLTPHRFDHTLGVADTAIILAVRFGADPLQAHWAGLLHDCAKNLSVKEMRQILSSDQDISTDAEELEEEAILHAPAGAILARDRYNMTDEAVLSAIRWHTTGCATMTKLDKIIYLADMIEPNRHTFEGLDELRRLACVDLDRAVVYGAQCSVNYIRQSGGHVNSNTLKMLRSLKELI